MDSHSSSRWAADDTDRRSNTGSPAHISHLLQPPVRIAAHLTTTMTTTNSQLYMIKLGKTRVWSLENVRFRVPDQQLGTVFHHHCMNSLTLILSNVNWKPFFFNSIPIEGTYVCCAKAYIVRCIILYCFFTIFNFSLFSVSPVFTM